MNYSITKVNGIHPLYRNVMATTPFNSRGDASLKHIKEQFGSGEEDVARAL